jgi:hypothetical protein
MLVKHQQQQQQQQQQHPTHAVLHAYTLSQPSHQAARHNCTPKSNNRTHSITCSADTHTDCCHTWKQPFKHVICQHVQRCSPHTGGRGHCQVGPCPSRPGRPCCPAHAGPARDDTHASDSIVPLHTHNHETKHRNTIKHQNTLLYTPQRTCGTVLQASDPSHVQRCSPHTGGRGHCQVALCPGHPCPSHAGPDRTAPCCRLCPCQGLVALRTRGLAAHHRAPARC